MYKKIIFIILILFVVFSCYFYNGYQRLTLVTNKENITYISSPFTNSVIDAKERKKIIESLNRMILGKRRTKESSDEILYSVTIHSKGGHTEDIIIYGNYLVQYYDRKFVNEYNVPFFTMNFYLHNYGGINYQD